MGAIQNLFQEFANISGLHINIAKTVLVPLFPFDLLELRAAICRAAPEWGGIGVSASTKYLGLMVGPGKGASSWTAPIRKYQRRAALWGHAGFGMHLSLRA